MQTSDFILLFTLNRDKADIGMVTGMRYSGSIVVTILITSCKGVTC